uniref:RNA (guanine-9-)-methyltransferase domain-containing protein 1 n=1 Tax=Caenorhabditis tropicalis TaxID=1561998 RepID=A0A1I7U5U8_9PELO
MEQLSNRIQLFKWNIRSLLKLPQKTVAPILWRPPTMTSSHQPSAEFLSNLSPQESQKVERILKEMHLFSRLSTRFPKKFKDSDWKTLLELKTRKARFDQAMFLYRKEQLEQEDIRKKKQIKEKRRSEAVARSRNPSHILPIQNSISEEWSQLRHIVEAYRLENHPILAVDCQFINQLSPRGRGLTALQLQYLISENRNSTNPFRLHLVNYNKNDSKVRDLEKDKLRCLQKSNIFHPMVTEEGLDTAFKNKEDVIYLSPDAKEELEYVDNEKIYVIGGIVDRVVEHGIPKHASLEAAQSANVSVRKLPIDRYIDFKSGSKFLTLLAVSEILRQVNLHGDWKKAMEVAIPVRNIRGVDEKNQKVRATQARIQAFNQEVLRNIDRVLGKDFDN